MRMMGSARGRPDLVLLESNCGILTEQGGKMTRKFTMKFLDAMDEGWIDPKKLAQNLMGYMSEREVEDFARAEGYFDHEEEDED